MSNRLQAKENEQQKVILQAKHVAKNEDPVHLLGKQKPIWEITDANMKNKVCELPIPKTNQVSLLAVLHVCFYDLTNSEHLFLPLCLPPL